MTDDRHERPAGVSDETVAAVGKVSEALEWIERARGRLYDFHQQLGRADLLFGEAADALEEAGHAEQAHDLRTRIVGRNVIDGRWTFQIVEEFDDLYWSAARDSERRIRDDLVKGRRHVFESEMKDERRTTGRDHHERRPPAAHDPQLTCLDD
ncbi:MAG: hypothetical protein JWM47_2366 [Acidimicrobiales bacterium]|nr:hypothetical protein [Acidimicrobiales bacterium]